MLKKLKFIYKCETYKELAELLGVHPQRIYDWQRTGIPPNIKALLEFIYQQKVEIDLLKSSEKRLKLEKDV